MLDILLVCKYKLDRQIAAQSRAFFNGLSDIIDPKCESLVDGNGTGLIMCLGLRMFDQQELQQLIGGEETMIDLDELRAHVVVSGFTSDLTMSLFWKVGCCYSDDSALLTGQVVKRFNQEERRALLRFVTSCSRPPL
jgi:ubiquitin-protein ligase E3 C